MQYSIEKCTHSHNQQERLYAVCVVLKRVHENRCQEVVIVSVYKACLRSVNWALIALNSLSTRGVRENGNTTRYDTIRSLHSKTERNGPASLV